MEVYTQNLGILAADLVCTKRTYCLITTVPIVLLAILNHTGLQYSINLLNSLSYFGQCGYLSLVICGVGCVLAESVEDLPLGIAYRDEARLDGCRICGVPTQMPWSETLLTHSVFEMFTVTKLTDQSFIWQKLNFESALLAGIILIFLLRQHLPLRLLQMTSEERSIACS